MVGASPPGSQKPNHPRDKPVGFQEFCQRLTLQCELRTFFYPVNGYVTSQVVGFTAPEGSPALLGLASQVYGHGFCGRVSNVFRPTVR